MPLVKRTRNWLSLALASLSLASCGTANFSCPTLKEYSLRDQRKLADELESAPSNAVWPKFIVDYSGLRDACRVVQND